MRMEVWSIYPCEDCIMKASKHCLERGEEKVEVGYIMEGVNLFSVHCMMYGIITTKLPQIINVCLKCRRKGEKGSYYAHPIMSGKAKLKGTSGGIKRRGEMKGTVERKVRGVWKLIK
jgi:hypothetical protein